MDNEPDIVLDELKGLRIKRAYANCGSLAYGEITRLTIEFDGGEELEIELQSPDWEITGIYAALRMGPGVIAVWE